MDFIPWHTFRYCVRRNDSSHKLICPDIV
ncbi:MAG: hypothetical protein F4239_04260 [Gammaproteobacteria bacterium]|nr:hypothetical protein [Gammaproteobacteria bacterium]